MRKSVEANSIFFSASEPFSKLLFLEKGLVRSYRVIDGKDITFYFFTAGEFAVDYESFLKESESSLFFEALVDCDYLEFSKSTIEALYDSFPAFERVGRIMAEQAYLSATSRVKELQAESLQDRYLKLLARNPELFQQIPQYHIASYLGVKPQSLSRVRAKLTGKIY
ncbi:Crp/Fnr family transcriptional regulator [Tunicatimonas pelagia]|uniref:Crp/Fnr family transcriptional regulator n=1 Tax=Tunicatimonas pelagia TaxID=931531 RepID=UPI00266508D6|nr:Crp/Fnr family transcriptional regulator [Tunicatimonas pelagia]WKN46338.1 Crp/Fnr family transcriptional regulator [Tunicatimonas pelagia]